MIDEGFGKRLRAGELLRGTMLTLPSPEVADMVARCGFDWLFLDGEHGSPTTLDWQRMLMAIGGRCASLLRVPSLGETCIKTALDLGVDGIIVPMVNSAELAREAVAWTRYPPQGRRGIGLARAQGYGLEFADYVENANDRLALVVQVEHIDAVENIEEIAAVDGLDAVFVGPYDLSASLGKTGAVDDPEVVAAIERVTRACRARGLALGYFGVSAASVLPYIERGFNLICAGTDAGLITGGAAEVLQQLPARD